MSTYSTPTPSTTHPTSVVSWFLDHHPRLQKHFLRLHSVVVYVHAAIVENVDIYTMLTTQLSSVDSATIELRAVDAICKYVGTRIGWLHYFWCWRIIRRLVRTLVRVYRANPELVRHMVVETSHYVADADDE